MVLFHLTIKNTGVFDCIIIVYINSEMDTSHAFISCLQDDILAIIEQNVKKEEILL